MAKLLSVYKAENQLINRQIPLIIDSSLIVSGNILFLNKVLVLLFSLKIVMQIDDFDSTSSLLSSSSSCLACEQMKIVKKKDYELFMRNYSLLINNYQQSSSISSSINDYLNSKIRFKTTDLLNSIQQLVTCIGCRTSVEKFYKQLNSSSKFNNKTIISALDPLNIHVNDGYIDLNENYINPKSLYNLFYSYE